MLTLVNAVFTSLVSLYSILWIGQIVNTITQGGEFQTVAIALLCYLAVQVLHACTNAWLSSLVFPKNVQVIREKMQAAIFEKASRMRYACFEDSQFYNQYYIATQQSTSRALAVLHSFSTLVGSTVGIVTLISLVSSVDFVSLLIVGINVLLSLILNARLAKSQKAYMMDNTPRERAMQYIHRVFTKKEYAKEIRSFQGLSKLLYASFFRESGKTKALIQQYGRPLFGMHALQGINSTLSYGALLGYFAYRVFASMINIGDFVVLINASQKLTQQSKELFNVLSQFYEHSLYIESFRDFMEKVPTEEENTADQPFPKNPSITLHGIGFRYPGTAKNVLEDLSLSMPFPSKVAIVGVNGAGKSTLIKLLLKLYEPTEGRITVNGVDYNAYSLSSLRESIGVVFQDYQLYDMSIAENILMRPVMDAEQDEKLVSEALRYVGLYEKVFSLPDGMHTMMTKEFCDNGTLFSGGEQQRIAIARICIKRSDVLILDEPSSALDPIAERTIMQDILTMARGKSLIIVSHKLNTILKVDKIYLLDGERVVEEGTHEELLLRNGLYATMYAEQTKETLRTPS